MEQKLKDYQTRRRKEKILDVLLMRGIMKKFSDSSASATSAVAATDSPNAIVSTESKNNSPLILSDDNISELSIASSNNSAWSYEAPASRLTVVTYLLYALLWGTVYALAILNGFGAVYFVISCIIGIYINTRTSPKREGEVSAYSVFNRNCEAIDGTLKAEQFEKEFNLIKHT